MLPSSVRRPSYDVGAISAGIVHLGFGAFHRAHMARYTHDLMQAEPDALRWGIVGAGLMPFDRKVVEGLLAQDRLYTLMENNGSSEALTVIGSVADIILAVDSSAALLDVMVQPRIRIVSLTVTEHGYCLNRATKRLDSANELIGRDLECPERPRSATGIIVEACRLRIAAGIPAFTALSCDNIQENGEVLSNAVLDLARLRGATLADRIGASVTFPSTMVDRITPVTTEADVAPLTTRHGIVDRCPVSCETFKQWVIEDRFAAGRPAWEAVGVQLLNDVAPYKMMKLRLLNASHLAVVGLGRLAGHATIDEAMSEPLMARYMVALMDRETGPTVPPVPGINMCQYKAKLVERFSNSAIKGKVERVNTDAPLNVLLDPIRHRLQTGGSLDLLSLALAAWLRRVRGEDEKGHLIDVRHPLAALLRERAIEGGMDPLPLLSIAQLFGSIGLDPRLLQPVRRWLSALYRDGSRATLAAAANELSF